MENGEQALKLKMSRPTRDGGRPNVAGTAERSVMNLNFCAWDAFLQALAYRIIRSLRLAGNRERSSAGGTGVFDKSMGGE